MFSSCTLPFHTHLHSTLSYTLICMSHRTSCTRLSSLWHAAWVIQFAAAVLLLLLGFMQLVEHATTTATINQKMLSDIGICTDGWMDGWMVEWMNGGTDGWTVWQMDMAKSGVNGNRNSSSSSGSNSTNIWMTNSWTDSNWNGWIDGWIVVGIENAALQR